MILTGCGQKEAVKTRPLGMQAGQSLFSHYYFAILESSERFDSAAMALYFPSDENQNRQELFPIDGSNHHLSCLGPTLFRVEGYGKDTLTIFDLTGTRPLKQFSLLGPDDRARGLFTVAPDQIHFITSDLGLYLRYEDASIGVIARSDIDSKFVPQYTRTFSLQEFHEGDGNPEIAYIQKVGNKIFVALQRLTRTTRGPWLAQNPSMLLEYSLADILKFGTQVKPSRTKQLFIRNPFGALSYDQNFLYVSGVQDFHSRERRFSGVEVVDRASLDTVRIVLRGKRITKTEVDGEFLYYFESLEDGTSIIGRFNLVTNEDAPFLKEDISASVSDMVLTPDQRLWVTTEGNDRALYRIDLTSLEVRKVATYNLFPRTLTLCSGQ